MVTELSGNLSLGQKRQRGDQDLNFDEQLRESKVIIKETVLNSNDGGCLELHKVSLLDGWGESIQDREGRRMMLFLCVDFNGRAVVRSEAQEHHKFPRLEAGLSVEQKKRRSELSTLEQKNLSRRLPSTLYFRLLFLSGPIWKPIISSSGIVQRSVGSPTVFCVPAGGESMLAAHWRASRAALGLAKIGFDAQLPRCPDVPRYCTLPRNL